MSDNFKYRVKLCLLSLLSPLLISFSTTGFGFAQKSVLPIQTWQTSNGTKVFYVYTPELPMIDIQLVFDAGSSRDGNKYGLARLTNEMLDAGTKNLNADEVATALDDVGAVYASSVNRDSAVLALRSLTDPKFLKPAVETFTEVLNDPSFPDREFSRIQKQTLAILTKQEEQPAIIATKAFYNSLYNDTPYGHPIAGTLESVKALTVNDLKDFYKQFYTAKNVIISIVGAVDRETAKKLAEQITGKLPVGNPTIKLAENSANPRAIQQHIPFDSAQTHILIGYLGIQQNDPSYFSAIVGNHIFGGGAMTSRLFDQVREKRGLAYSVFSQFIPLREKGPFVIELQTRKDEANNAINIVNKTLRDYIEKGPTASELDSSKKNIVRGFMLRLAGNAAIIAQLNNIGFYNLPLNYLDTYRDNINKVTGDQIKSVFKQLLPVDKLITVTVGFNNLLNHAKN